jgi:polyferredoxin
MNTPYSLALVFVALAVVFLGISFRDYLKTEGKLTIARKIWLRMAFIFAGVGIGLYLVHTFLR